MTGFGQAATEPQDDGGSQSSDAEQDPKNTGNDLTRPQNSLDLRVRNLTLGSNEPDKPRLLDCPYNQPDPD